MFCKIEVTFVIYKDLLIFKLIARCAGCHVWGRRLLLNPEQLVVLSAGPISHTKVYSLGIGTLFYSIWIEKCVNTCERTLALNTWISL